MKSRYAISCTLLLLLFLPVFASYAQNDLAGADRATFQPLQDRLQRTTARHLSKVALARSYESSAKASDGMRDRIGTRTHLIFDEDQWENHLQSRFTFQNARVASETTFGWHDDEWAAHYRYITAYHDGLIASILFEEWDEEEEAWVPYDREVFTSEGGKITGVMSQTYVDGEWVNVERLRFVYDGGTLVRVDDEYWDGDVWQPEYRTLVSQIDGDVVLIEQKWEGSEWVNEQRMTFHDITISTLLNLEFELMEDQYGLGFLMILMPDITTELWEDGAWHFAERMRSEKDDQDRPEFLYFESYEDEVWIAEGRFAFVYLGSGVLGSVSMQMLVDEDEDIWFSMFTEAYEYDSQNRLISAQTSMQFSPEMIFYLSRIEFDWVQVPVSVEKDQMPVAFRLDPAYPNPFNPTTTITFHILGGGQVSLRVYDAMGRLVSVLVDGARTPGRYEVAFDASGMASGHYYIRMEGAGFHQTRSITLVK
jgi:hypothetical protein